MYVRYMHFLTCKQTCFWSLDFCEEMYISVFADLSRNFDRMQVSRNSCSLKMSSIALSIYLCTFGLMPTNSLFVTFWSRFRPKYFISFHHVLFVPLQQVIVSDLIPSIQWCHIHNPLLDVTSTKTDVFTFFVLLALY